MQLRTRPPSGKARTMGDDDPPAGAENEPDTAPRCEPPLYLEIQSEFTALQGLRRARPFSPFLFFPRGEGGGFGGFKKKGAFGRGNVRKRAVQDEDNDDDLPASSAVAPAERKKKVLALGGSTARDDKVFIRVFLHR